MTDTRLRAIDGVIREMTSYIMQNQFQVSRVPCHAWVGRDKRENVVYTLINVLEELVANGYARKNETFKKPGTSSRLKMLYWRNFLIPD